MPGITGFLSLFFLKKEADFRKNFVLFSFNKANKWRFIAYKLNVDSSTLSLRHIVHVLAFLTYF